MAMLTTRLSSRAMKSPKQAAISVYHFTFESLTRLASPRLVSSAIASSYFLVGGCFGADRQRAAFNIDARNTAVQPLREPPVPLAQQLHGRGDQDHPDDRGVNQDRHR